MLFWPERLQLPPFLSFLIWFFPIILFAKVQIFLPQLLAPFLCRSFSLRHARLDARTVFDCCRIYKYAAGSKHGVMRAWSYSHLEALKPRGSLLPSNFFGPLYCRRDQRSCWLFSPVTLIICEQSHWSYRPREVMKVRRTIFYVTSWFSFKRSTLRNFYFSILTISQDTLLYALSNSGFSRGVRASQSFYNQL